MYPSSFVGCHAGDHESYTDFHELFDAVIEGYHKGYKVGVSKHITDMDVSKITTDLSESAKSKIVSTRIRVARNLAMFPLNPGLLPPISVCEYARYRLDPMIPSLLIITALFLAIPMSINYFLALDRRQHNFSSFLYFV
jgi:hypothetical protein